MVKNAAGSVERSDSANGGRLDIVPEEVHGTHVISANTPYGYSRMHRAAELASMAMVALLLIAFVVQIARTVTTGSGALRLALTGLSAYVASDLISGVVHWAGDTLGDESVPFVGPNFIKPFRIHHVDQLAITRHDLVETNGNNCIVVLGPLTAAFLVLPARDGWLFDACVFMAFLAAFVVATNQFHKWAHQPNPPAIARVLQASGLILTTPHHDRHHAPPHDRNYCITVGWLNPLLDFIGFFRGAEWVVAQVRPHWLHVGERVPGRTHPGHPGASPAPRGPRGPDAVGAIGGDSVAARGPDLLP
jgi:ubiquitin-conjugating enzyme E2 variant